jgi:hypothetical protein
MARPRARLVQEIGVPKKMIIAAAATLLSTVEVLTACGITRNQLTLLRKENPSLQPTKVVGPRYLLWSAEIVDEVRRLAAQRFRPA